MNRRSVDPAFTFGISFAISLALWLPTLRGTLTGEIEITDAGIRYLLTLAIAWAGVTAVSAIVAMFASKPRGPVSPPPTGSACAPAVAPGPRGPAMKCRRATPPEGQAAGRGFARLACSLLPAPDQAVTLGRREATPHAVAGPGLERVLEALLAHRARRADRLGFGRLRFGRRGRRRRCRRHDTRRRRTNRSGTCHERLFRKTRHNWPYNVPPPSPIPSPHGPKFAATLPASRRRVVSRGSGRRSARRGGTDDERGRRVGAVAVLGAADDHDVAGGDVLGRGRIGLGELRAPARRRPSRRCRWCR